ncbi:MAG: CoB--CoM heterodisulfide reductase iron-sulfur subunit B family protein [Candidatus Heimdallarchaeota archaeon]|nr:CoB--CoM heterodisulfide reductase iron-sulfur subunit B family protein [Candidatus Heimdallarchaeota archaeon]MCK4769602.1 CoB--CoM heterodisulfide reductase iron-sulfur subunit B family protein [Candidatus Heimdallarchaeota archaeon]
MAESQVRLNYKYYPGCALDGIQKAYRMSTEAVAKKLGITLNEMKDWNCCGGPSVIAVDEIKALALSAKNLAMVQKETDQLVTPCNTCFGTLKKANNYMDYNKKIYDAVNGALGEIGLSYEPHSVTVRHFVDILFNDYGVNKLKSKVTRPLTDIRVVPFYGCHFSRPFGEHDDVENPQKMDELIKITGAEWVDFPMKYTCCGATLNVSDKNIGYRLLHEILRTAKEVKADCIVTACPLCQTNLEMFQRVAGNRFGEKHKIPVIYITQLVGYSLGISSKDLMLNKVLVKPKVILAKK